MNEIIGNEFIDAFSSLIVFLQVYEYITYDNQKHETIAKLPGMQGRTIITSSLSKTFSVTGPNTKASHSI